MSLKLKKIAASREYRYISLYARNPWLRYWYGETKGEIREKERRKERKRDRERVRSYCAVKSYTTVVPLTKLHLSRFNCGVADRKSSLWSLLSRWDHSLVIRRFNSRLMRRASLKRNFFEREKNVFRPWRGSRDISVRQANLILDRRRLELINKSLNI